MILCLAATLCALSGALTYDSGPSDKTLQYLADYCLTDIEEDSRSVLGNVTGKRLIVLAVTGMLLESRAQDSRWDDARDQIGRELGSVAQGLGMTGLGQTGWIYPFTALYEFERAHWRHKRPRNLERLVDAILDNQDREGGWGHSARALVSFYPSTLIATTNLALMVLGMARDLDLDVAPHLEDGLGLLTRVQGSTGAFPYGGASYMKGYEAGRTAASLLALAAVDVAKSDSFARASRFTQNNLAHIPKGHASPALHIFLGAHAARLIGEQTWHDYDREVLEEVRRARLDDGSYADVIEDSPDQMEQSFSEFGAHTASAYITAMYAAALDAPLARWTRKLQEKVVPNQPATPVESPLTTLPIVWSREPEQTLRDMVPFGGGVALVGEDGSVSLIDAQSGNTRWFERAASAEDSQPQAITTYADGEQLLVARQPMATEVFSTLGSRIDGSDHSLEPHKHQTGSLHALDASGTKWRRELRGNTASLALNSSTALRLKRDGVIELIDRHSGKADLIESSSVLVNSHIRFGRDGRIVRASENKLESLDAEGFAIWEKKVRGPRNLTPPAFGSLATSGEFVFAGTTSGEVWCVDEESGKGLWRVSIGRGVRRIRSPQETHDPLLIESGDACLIAFDPESGEETYRLEYGDATESAEPGKWLILGGRVYIHHPHAERLIEVDLFDGSLKRSFRVSREQKWTIAAGTLVIGDSERLRGYALSP